MDVLLMKLAELGPIIALLVIAIYYFLKKESEYKKQISDLNLELRATEKENLTVLYKVLAYLKKLKGEDEEL